MGSMSNDSGRPLLLATAGHVDHGKSSFIKALTGVDPDRLPQEKQRGMTLDLGFVHTPTISFVDCPGHESLIRHMVAGHHCTDGVCLVVAANEGVSEQTREHVRILNWLKVKSVLVVISKVDLLKTDMSLVEASGKVEKLYAQVRDLLQPAVRTGFIPFSAHDPELVLTAKNRCENFFTAEAKVGSHSYNRFFIDRAFSLKGIGTVITGSFSEGVIEAGHKYRLWIPGREKIKTVTVRSIRRDQTSFEWWSTPGRIALSISGAHPEELRRGSILLTGSTDFESDGEPALTKELVLSLDWAIPVKKQMTGILQVGTLSIEGRLQLHRTGVFRCRLKEAAPVRQLDTIIVRLPERIRNFGHTVASGVVTGYQVPSAKATRPKLEEAPKKAEASETFSVEIQTGSQELLSQISSRQWDAFFEIKDSDPRIGPLLKTQQVFKVKEGHYLHHERYKELLSWLNVHFKKKETLDISDARSFFNTGRKSFLEILEFCDRLQWTFRKENVRKKFKLPLI